MSCRLSIAGVLTVLVLTLLVGCTSRAERLYRRAETFLAQGQHTMAAEEYQRIVTEEPDSDLADDALYKLAYVYAEELDQPTVGLVKYRALADSYPGSPWVDDALMRVMAIQRETLNDPAAVRRTWGEVCKRFEGRKKLCARGLLEVARAHFDAENYVMAAATSDELSADYPDQQTACAQAALLHARASERMGLDQAEVEALYESVIERYPDTHAAAMAKRNIGWNYYVKREEHAQEQAAEVERRSRVIGGVPAHAERGTRLLQAVSALRAALAHRGEHRSMEWLVCLHGAPFAVMFDPGRPSAAANALQANPFEIITEALGFAHNKFSGASAKSAFDTVHQALLQGHPVLLRHGSPARWVIVTGYDMRDGRVLYMPPGREAYAASSRDEFLSGWRAGSGDGSGVAGAEPFYQFSLGARLTQPSEEALLRAVTARAAEVMQRASLTGAPAGAAAWQEAGKWLEQCIASDDAAALQSARSAAAAWVEDGLRPHLSIAQMAMPVLEKAEQTIPALAGASGRYAELLQEQELVARKVTEATVADEDATTKWQAAAAQANYVSALHQRLAEQMAGAANGE
ncbi:MAG: tetratricopeptide repeat protein [Armatimonadia bacterium]|nr:tetratricopeptide repeat protein [Armatimonadia bacterium]